MTAPLTKKEIDKIKSLTGFIKENEKLLKEFDCFKEQLLTRVWGIVGHEKGNSECDPEYLCDCFLDIETQLTNHSEECNGRRFFCLSHHLPQLKNINFDRQIAWGLHDIVSMFYVVDDDAYLEFKQEGDSVYFPSKLIYYENLLENAENINICLPKKFDYYDEDFRKLRLQVFLRDGEICASCGAKPGKGLSLTIDHIKPVSKFPELARDISNLQVLCWDCNLSKSDKV